VENSGINIMLKNEFAAGAAGDLVPHETWLELWVMDDADYDRAIDAIDASFSNENALEWVCGNCLEVNDASFEFCWKCLNGAP